MLKNEKLLKKVRTEPCVACGMGYWDMNSGEWRNQAHHVITKGMGGGKRDDTTAVSMCYKCHLDLHSYPKTFKEKYGIEMYNKLRSIK